MVRMEREYEARGPAWNLKYGTPAWLRVVERRMPGTLSRAGLFMLVSGTRYCPTWMRKQRDLKGSYLARLADALGIERGDFFVAVIREMEAERVTNQGG
jgi:hypothetical protein